MKLFHPNEKKDSDPFLFYTTIHERRNPISADTVARFFNIYAKKAHEKCAETPEHIHPPMLRHTRAMPLYRNGMPMIGYVSLQVYAKWLFRGFLVDTYYFQYVADFLEITFDSA